MITTVVPCLQRRGFVVAGSVGRFFGTAFAVSAVNDDGLDSGRW